MMSVTTAFLSSGSSGYLDGYMDKTAGVRFVSELNKHAALPVEGGVSKNYGKIKVPQTTTSKTKPIKAEKPKNVTHQQLQGMEKDYQGYDKIRQDYEKQLKAAKNPADQARLRKMIEWTNREQGAHGRRIDARRLKMLEAERAALPDPKTFPKTIHTGIAGKRYETEAAIRSANRRLNDAKMRAALRKYPNTFEGADRKHEETRRENMRGGEGTFISMGMMPYAPKADHLQSSIKRQTDAAKAKTRTGQFNASQVARTAEFLKAQRARNYGYSDNEYGRSKAKEDDAGYLKFYDEYYKKIYPLIKKYDKLRETMDAEKALKALAPEERELMQDLIDEGSLMARDQQPGKHKGKV